jgi:hypothetical protein
MFFDKERKKNQAQTHTHIYRKITELPVEFFSEKHKEKICIDDKIYVNRKKQRIINK